MGTQSCSYIEQMVLRKGANEFQALCDCTGRAGGQAQQSLLPRKIPETELPWHWPWKPQRALHRLLGYKEPPRGKVSFKVKAGSLESHSPSSGTPHGCQLHSAENICLSVCESDPWSGSAQGKRSRRRNTGKDTIHHPFSGTETSQ